MISVKYQPIYYNSYIAKLAVIIHNEIINLSRIKLFLYSKEYNKNTHKNTFRNVAS